MFGSHPQTHGTSPDVPGPANHTRNPNIPMRRCGVIPRVTWLWTSRQPGGIVFGSRLRYTRFRVGVRISTLRPPTSFSTQGRESAFQMLHGPFESPFVGLADRAVPEGPGHGSPASVPCSPCHLGDHAKSHRAGLEGKCLGRHPGSQPLDRAV